ncbi:MAG TPA: superoxide dismutase family protein [Xanthomonadaceae bacterium]|jgi:Cu-Zn family superoxide dismutase
MLRPAIVSTCVFALALSGCASHSDTKPAKLPRHPIEAVLAPVGEGKVAGTLEITEVPGGVRIQGQITGLVPDSMHGIHIHEHGDCTGADSGSVGGHFNPTGVEHGDPVGLVHHAGDIANQVADAQGTINMDVTLHGVSLANGTSDDVLGRAVVLDHDTDDYSTQPSGNSGPAIACGVILKKTN